MKKTLLYLFIITSILTISNSFYYRLDLTNDKRYTLSKNTEKTLTNNTKEIFIEIFLDGQLPPAFNKLKDRIEDLIKELNKTSKKEIHYRFFDPTSIQNEEKKNRYIGKLIEKGIQPTNINRKTSNENISQQIIFPSLIIYNSEKEVTVNLLKNNPSLNSEENINNSIESLEYELINAINIINRKTKQNIAFLYGHGEISKSETADVGITLADYYNVKLISCKDIYKDIKKYSAIIVAQPRKDFSEKDKYIIDQYIMYGGKILWLIDQVDANLDSLRFKSEIFSQFKPLNIEDILFHYGVRINPDLILDGQCTLIPIKTSLKGETAKFSPAPWYYSPLITPNNTIIGKNVNPIRLDFTNSIDTVNTNQKVRKEVLLQSSEYTRLENVPNIVSLRIVETPINKNIFNTRNKILGVLLEGRFTSAFNNRKINTTTTIPFKEESIKNKMIVISDGDIIKNKVVGKGRNTKIIPLGYDRFTKQTYGNKTLILNAINYLCDEAGLMQLRKRETKLRMLNKTKIKTEKSYWQYLNILSPLIILILLGIFCHYLRKKRYQRTS